MGSIIIALCPVKSNLLPGRIPLEIFHGKKECKGTPASLTTIDVFSLWYWGLPQSLPMLIPADGTPQSSHCFISFLRLMLLWWDLLSGAQVADLICLYWGCTSAVLGPTLTYRSWLQTVVTGKGLLIHCLWVPTCRFSGLYIGASCSCSATAEF